MPSPEDILNDVRKHVENTYEEEYFHFRGALRSIGIRHYTYVGLRNIMLVYKLSKYGLKIFNVAMISNLLGSNASKTLLFLHIYGDKGVFDLIPEAIHGMTFWKFNDKFLLFLEQKHGQRPEEEVI